MFPWNTTPPYPFYPTPTGMSPEQFYKKMMKAQKKATLAAEAKAKESKDKDKPKPKSKWETLDIIHMSLALIVMSPIVGPLVGIQLIHIYKGFADTLSTMLK